MSQTQEYKLISWNVNGLRAVLKKEPSFTEIFETIKDAIPILVQLFSLSKIKQSKELSLSINDYVYAFLCMGTWFIF